MSQSANTALARRWFDDVWNKRREATITEVLDPGAVGHLEGLVTRGVAAFLTARAFLIGAFPDLRIAIDDMVSEGDNVVVRWAVTGTHRGPIWASRRPASPSRFAGSRGCALRKDGSSKAGTRGTRAG